MAQDAYLNVLAIPSLEGVQKLQARAVGVNLQVHLTGGWCLVGLFACTTQLASGMLLGCHTFLEPSPPSA